MAATSGLERAFQLFDLHKYSLAIKEADTYLASEPNDSQAFLIKALCYLNQRKETEAFENARQSITHAPADPAGHYVLSLVHLNLTSDYRLAEVSVREAIRLNPHHADYFDVLAQLLYVQNKHVEALKTVENGLKIDPRNSDCLGTRARILARLKNGNEAVQHVHEALKQDAASPMSHANAGWVYLENGDHKRALESFREALRLDPDLEYAKGGLLQALKAKRFVFRQYLNFSAFMSRTGSKFNTILFVGLAILVGLLKVVPQLWPLMAVYAVFAISTWLLNPILNLFLRFDKYGKQSLKKSQKVTSDVIAGVLLVTLGLVIGGVVTGMNGLYFGAGAVFTLTLPISGTEILYNVRGSYRKSIAYTAFLLLLIVLGFLAISEDFVVGAVFFGLAIAGAILYTWILAFTGKLS